MPEIRPQPKRESGATSKAYACTIGVSKAEIGAVRTAAAWTKVLAHAVASWLDDVCQTEASRTTYEAHALGWFGAEPARLTDQLTMTARDVSRHLERMQGGDRYRSTRLQVVRSWFTWLLDHELIEKHPVNRDIKRAYRYDAKLVLKGDQQRQALTPSEAQTVVDWSLREAAPECGLAVMLMLTGGLRRAEVVRADARHWADREIDGERVVTLTVLGKGRKSRRIICEAPLIAAYERYRRARRLRGQQGALLRPLHGDRYSPFQIYWFAKQAAEVVGRRQEISSHDLRRTCASLLRKRGASDDQVREHLGHADVKTTLECYTVYGNEMMARTGLEVR